MEQLVEAVEGLSIVVLVVGFSITVAIVAIIFKS